MARRTRIGLYTFLRHPLPLIVLPLFILLTVTGAADGLRLLVLEPVALASSDTSQADPSTLSPDQQAHAAKLEADADRVSLAHANSLLRQGHSQLAEFAASGIESTGAPIPARITMRGDSSQWRHSIRINRGTDHGIKPGYAVTVGRTLVGVVTQCTGGQSLVSLITDPGVSVGVTILPKDGAAAIAMLQASGMSVVSVSSDTSGTGAAKNTSKSPDKGTPPGGSLKDLSLLQENEAATGTPNRQPAPANKPAFRLPGIPEGTPEEMARALGPKQRATRGMLKGAAKQSPRFPRLPIEDVDVDTGVVPGMLVVTNDAAGALPAGLLVGFVSDVSNRNTFLHVEVACACDVSLVDVVLVIPYDRPSWDEVTRMFGK